MSNKRLDPEERRKQILIKAMELAIDAGTVFAVTSGDVARSLGVSRNLVIYYFGGADGLIHEVLKHMVGLLPCSPEKVAKVLIDASLINHPAVAGLTSKQVRGLAARVF